MLEQAPEARFVRQSKERAQPNFISGKSQSKFTAGPTKYESIRQAPAAADLLDRFRARHVKWNGAWSGRLMRLASGGEKVVKVRRVRHPSDGFRPLKSVISGRR